MKTVSIRLDEKTLKKTGMIAKAENLERIRCHKAVDSCGP